MTMQDKTLKRVAIVGFGFMGRMHYGCWKKVEGAKIVALCDKDTSQFKAPIQGGNLKGADASVDFGDAAIYDDFDQMLAEAKPDIISLTLPTTLHVPLTVKALNAGVSVLCEKPMALDAVSCETMINAAKNAPNGAKLMVGQCLRFWPAYVYLKELINTKKFGKVIAASFRRYSAPPGWGKGKSWFLDEKKSGGVALDLHIHDTDIIQYLFGVPKSVTSTASYNSEGTMLYISTLYNVGSPAVTAEGSWAMTPTLGFEAGYVVTFEKAVVILDAKRPKPLCVYPMDGAPFEPKLPEGDGYAFEIQWFMDTLCGKKVDLITTPEQSRDSVRIVDAEKQSAKTGNTINL